MSKEAHVDFLFNFKTLIGLRHSVKSQKMLAVRFTLV